MGLTYLIDILPPKYLPTANAIAAVHFSVGSMLGPYGGGLAMQYISTGSLFYMVAAILISFLLLLIFYHLREPSRHLNGELLISSSQLMLISHCTNLFYVRFIFSRVLSISRERICTMKNRKFYKVGSSSYFIL